MNQYKDLFILIAIVAVIAGGVYIMKRSHDAKQPDLAAGTSAITSPRSCATAADTFFHSWLTAPGNSDEGVLTNGQITHQAHFSTSTKQCYVRIDSRPQYATSNQPGTASKDYLYLFNVGTGKTIASSNVTMSDTVELCLFNDLPAAQSAQNCHDYTSFIAHINALMTS